MAALAPPRLYPRTSMSVICTLARQVRDDLAHRCVQVVPILLEIARDAGAGARHDEAREGGRGHGQDVIAGAVENGAQRRELRGVAVASGSRNDDRQRRRLVLRRKPHAQPAVEPEERRAPARAQGRSDPSRAAAPWRAAARYPAAACRTPSRAAPPNRRDPWPARAPAAAGMERILASEPGRGRRRRAPEPTRQFFIVCFIADSSPAL